MNGKNRAEQNAELYLRAIEALALAIEAKDHTTHNHLAARGETSHFQATAKVTGTAFREAIH
jgi:hypothetical protein